MMRSFDPELFKAAVAPYPDVFRADGFDFEDWLNNHNNLMFEDNGSIGLFSYEYPGLYTGHWFFKVRGTEAQSLAKKMLNEVFKNHNAKAIRGLTETCLKHASLAAKKLGFCSVGFIPGGIGYEDKDYEILVLTKNDFYQKEEL